MGSVFSGSQQSSTNTESSTRILTFHSTSRWQTHFATFKDSPKLIVIDFYASWCGPCRLIEPALIELAEKFTDVEFIKIDVDELVDVAQEYKVQAMPTFFLMKEGKQIDQVVGAKKDELEKKIEKHMLTQG